MAVYGLGLGANDAASNMQAVAVEHSVGRPMMPSFHAAWTAGGLLATLGAIALPDLRFGDRVGGARPVPAGPGLRAVPAPRPRQRGGRPERPRGAVAAVMLVGLGLVLFYAVDTAVTAWGPVYLSSDQVFTDPPTSPAMYALATLPYLVATLLARSAGDRATARFGAPNVVRLGSVVAFVGLAIVVFAPAAVWQVGVVGFFVVGLGVAVVAPLAFSAAARVAGAGRPDRPAPRTGPGSTPSWPGSTSSTTPAPCSVRCSPEWSARARCGSASPCRWCSCSACSPWPATSPPSAPPTDPSELGGCPATT